MRFSRVFVFLVCLVVFLRWLCSRISLAALLESPVKWVYTVPGWLVGGSNLQLSFPNDGIAGLGPPRAAGAILLGSRVFQGCFARHESKERSWSRGPGGSISLVSSQARHDKDPVRKQIVATFDPNRSGTYGDGGDGAEAIGIESYVNAVVDDDSKLLVKQGKESGVIQLGPAYQEPLGSTYLSV
ncbi:hypothetical protein YC2023_020927 [Brassica napus]